MFQRAVDKLPADYKEARAQLVRALHRGKVSDLRTLSDGRTQIKAEFYLLGYSCTIRLRHLREHWELLGSPVLEKREHRSKVLPVTAASLLAVVAVFGLWLIFDNTADSADSLEKAIETVKENGYVVLTPEQKDQLAAQAEKAGYEKAKAELAKQKTQNVVATRQASATDQTKAGAALNKETDQLKEEQEALKEGREKEKLVFTMRSGMTTQDLTLFLKENGLIKDRIAFGNKLEKMNIATKIDVGQYVFTSDMKEGEVLEVLKKSVVD